MNLASPLHCPGCSVYVRPDRGRVCLGCGALLAPGAAAWVVQTVRECAPGLHQWEPPPADDTPRQCRRCPAVESKVAAPSATALAERSFPAPTPWRRKAHHARGGQA